MDDGSRNEMNRGFVHRFFESCGGNRPQGRPFRSIAGMEVAALGEATGVGIRDGLDPLTDPRIRVTGYFSRSL